MKNKDTKKKMITLGDDNECGFVSFEDTDRGIKLTVYIGRKKYDQTYSKATIRRIVKQLDKMSSKEG